MRVMIGRSAILAVVSILLMNLAPSHGLAQSKLKIPPPLVFEQKTQEDGSKSPGKVTFDHDKHVEKGQKCLNCHGKGKPFKNKAGTSPDMNMKAYNEGKTCGTCHTGKVSFSTKEIDNCLKCHKPSS